MIVNYGWNKWMGINDQFPFAAWSLFLKGNVMIIRFRLNEQFLIIDSIKYKEPCIKF